MKDETSSQKERGRERTIWIFSNVEAKATMPKNNKLIGICTQRHKPQFDAAADMENCDRHISLVI